MLRIWFPVFYAWGSTSHQLYKTTLTRRQSAEKRKNQFSVSNMATLRSLVFIFVISGWTLALAEDIPLEGSAITSNNRQPRHLLQAKLCLKLGLCGGGFNQGYGGHQGGYGGHQGYGGYPPINIGISQSQSSSSAGGGGYGSGYFPNNYQYNGGYPEGYHGGYQKPGYHGNGFGSYNNQFNGNYYGGRPQGGGYGFQGPYGGFNDEGYGNDEKPVYDDQDEYYRSAKSKN